MKTRVETTNSIVQGKAGNERRYEHTLQELLDCDRLGTIVRRIQMLYIESEIHLRTVHIKLDATCRRA